jgi:ribosome biogenesis GTPase
MDFFQTEKEKYQKEGFTIARVIAEHREMYTILDDGNAVPAEVTGRLMYAAQSRIDYPAVGDWVAIQRFENSNAVIHHVLPRRTFISRKTSGREFNEQLIATNIDIVFVVQSLDHNYNLRRLERFLVVAHESGAVPAVLLSKTDLLSDDEVLSRIAEVHTISPGAAVIAYSAKSLSHIDEIQRLIAPETTVCFIGSSGVGKSTLINRLVGSELLATQEVREEDSRGRHTTTHRQLVPLANGGFVIDTPGMRELGLWSTTGSIEEIFPEFAALAQECKFTDCEHIHEPGCAVQQALADGTIDRGRYESYLKLKKEADYVAAKTDIRKQQERKAKEKQFGRMLKSFKKTRKKK